jgi:hypothetical protein
MVNMAESTGIDRYEAPRIEQRTDIGPTLIGGPLSSTRTLSAAFRPL